MEVLHHMAQFFPSEKCYNSQLLFSFFIITTIIKLRQRKCTIIDLKFRGSKLIW